MLKILDTFIMGPISLYLGAILLNNLVTVTASPGPEVNVIAATLFHMIAIALLWIPALARIIHTLKAIAQ